MDINEQYLELSEELETLRASNTIKQGNIERLEAENEQLEDKLQEQLCTVGSLLEENAKLIAERDELIHDRDMLKMCADHYEDELKRMHAERDDVLGRKRADELAENGDMYADVYCEIVDLIDPHVKRCPKDNGKLPASVVHSVEFLFEFWIKHKAEREAMMKQEPAVLAHIRMEDDGPEIDVEVLDGTNLQPEMSPIKLFAHLLPAQQIPEGYALADKTELNKIHRDLDSCQKVIWLAGGFDPSYCKDAQESLKLIDAMLSASQPKGELI